jgi:hypothetical protein
MQHGSIHLEVLTDSTSPLQSGYILVPNGIWLQVSGKKKRRKEGRKESSFLISLNFRLTDKEL